MTNEQAAAVHYYTFYQFQDKRTRQCSRGEKVELLPVDKAAKIIQHLGRMSIRIIRIEVLGGRHYLQSIIGELAHFDKSPIDFDSTVGPCFIGELYLGFS